MNNLLVYNHHLHNFNQSINNLSKALKDIEDRINGLELRFVTLEASIPKTENQCKETITKDTVKTLIKTYVDNAIQSIITDQSDPASPQHKEEVVSETDFANVLENMESQNIIESLDDIVIEEKKKKNGKKNRTKSN